MSIPFAELRKLKSAGLSLSAILVHSYVEEHGPTPYGLIAQACGISVRSVELAFEKFRELELVPVTKKISHEHVTTEHNDDHEHPQPVADEPAKPCEPLETALLETGLKPWAVQDLLARLQACEFTRERVENQLAYHRHRLAVGYKFKNPQGFLFRAIVHNWLPLDTYHRDRQPDAPQPAPRVAPAPARPVAEPDARDATTTLEDRMTSVRVMLASPLAVVRASGRRRAAEWGLPLAELLPAATG